MATKIDGTRSREAKKKKCKSAKVVSKEDQLSL